MTSNLTLGGNAETPETISHPASWKAATIKGQRERRTIERRTLILFFEDTIFIPAKETP